MEQNKNITRRLDLINSSDDESVKVYLGATNDKILPRTGIDLHHFVTIKRNTNKIN